PPRTRRRWHHLPARAARRRHAGGHGDPAPLGRRRPVRVRHDRRVLRRRVHIASALRMWHGSGMGYLETAKELYRDVAVTPEPGLCCTTSPAWARPDLVVPPRMLEMNYGCGTTVHPRDLAGAPTVVYVGAGGGLELLQFAYFSRRPGAVIGIEPVAEMR